MYAGVFKVVYCRVLLIGTIWKQPSGHQQAINREGWYTNATPVPLHHKND